MYNIQTLNKIAACGTDLMDKAKYNIGEEVATILSQLPEPAQEQIISPLTSAAKKAL